MRLGLRERHHGEPRAARLAAQRELRQERHAGAAAHHLDQRAEAGGSEVALFVGARLAAHRERLRAQAVAVVEQQHRLAREVALAQAAAAREAVAGGQRDVERVAEQRARGEVAERRLEREQQHVELAALERRDQIARLRLAQAQPQLRVAAAHARQRAREQIGRDGRDHAESQRPGQRALERE